MLSRLSVQKTAVLAARAAALRRAERAVPVVVTSTSPYARGLATALTTAQRHISWPSFGSSSSSSSHTVASSSSSSSGAAGSSSSTPNLSEDPEHIRLVTAARREADQYSERLLDACLNLLEVCGGSSTGKAASNLLGHNSREVIWELADVLLHDFRRSPIEQFDLVYIALCLPDTRNHREVQRPLMVILESILPQQLYRVFENVDLVITGTDDQSYERKMALVSFVHAVLGGIDPPAGVEEEEVLMVLMDDFKKAFPAVLDCKSFAELETDAGTIAMKAKLFGLLSQLCAEFDQDRTGKVALSDLQQTAQRVLGKEQADLLLSGAQADEEGKIRYPQLAAILTRPPPVVVRRAQTKAQEDK